jgi:hypothetical protein
MRFARTQSIDALRCMRATRIAITDDVISEIYQRMSESLGIDINNAANKSNLLRRVATEVLDL